MRAVRVIRVNLDSPPLASTIRADGQIPGYEPAATEHVAERLGLEIEWIFRPWVEMVPALLAGDGDVVWCGQGVTEERRQKVDFTHPYAIFDETVLARSGSGIVDPIGLANRRVAAITASTNMALAETFDGAELVAFDGDGEDVFGEMVEALRSGEVDAVVDDDVVTVPLGSDPDFEVAFTVATANRWAVAVAKDQVAFRDELSEAIRGVIADGSLAGIWAEWIPDLPFPKQLTHGL